MYKNHHRKFSKASVSWGFGSQNNNLMGQGKLQIPDYWINIQKKTRRDFLDFNTLALSTKVRSHWSKIKTKYQVAMEEKLLRRSEQKQWFLFCWGTGKITRMVAGNNNNKRKQPCGGFSCHLTNHSQCESAETICSQNFHCGTNNMKLLW